MIINWTKKWSVCFWLLSNHFP